MDDITTCWERGGQPEWDNNDYSRDFTYLGINRNMFPMAKHWILEWPQPQCVHDWQRNPNGRWIDMHLIDYQKSSTEKEV